jgi:general stress protein 26
MTPERVGETTPERLLEAARSVIASAGFCFLVTLGESGHPNARFMQPFEPDEELRIRFGASAGARKVSEIRRDPRATAAFGYAPEGAYVTLLGTARVDDDPAGRRKYWRESFRDYWPEGPEGSDYLLIEFVPFRIEIMDIRRSVAPDPFGLRAAVLVREENGWRVSRR